MQFIVEGIKNVQQAKVGVLTVEKKHWIERLKKRRRGLNTKNGEWTTNGSAFVNTKKQVTAMKRSGDK
ncbi:hypothetical protein MUN89_04940 [Halobacillus salinarum]|uniref:Uncharacterized protein n=1 Tax=Halobacillus salinarum TaxID=2932257 RepID=A0ABY4EMD4_9BACI|nr:hypothetical protein [Halobacillus salinarum]UOQ45298.1 hypothetical protein MUN89_04940 [Halobacillus salinarum]